MNTKKINDLILGDKSENEAKRLLSAKWEINDLQKTEKYHVLDFYSQEKDMFFEIKSRRNKHNTYDSTMIGQNKIEFAKCLNKPVIFVFVFSDGVYYYDFDINDKFTTSTGGRNDRGKPEYKQYYFIPTNRLIKI